MLKSVATPYKQPSPSSWPLPGRCAARLDHTCKNIGICCWGLRVRTRSTPPPHPFPPLTRTCAHAHTRTSAHTHTRTRAHEHTRTHARTRTHTHTRAHARTRTHARTHAHTHAHTHTRTHAHTHSRAHTRAHTHTHVDLSGTDETDIRLDNIKHSQWLSSSLFGLGFRPQIRPQE